MSRRLKLIVGKEEGSQFYNQMGRPIDVEPDNVEDVLLLTLGCAAEQLSNGYIKPEEVERIKKFTHQERLDLLLSKGDLEIREIDVNDDIEKLPKEIKYGNGFWKPEILVKLNNRMEGSYWRDEYCHYDQFPGGIYIWEIRYKHESKPKYMNTNNAKAFSSEHLVGVGITLSDAVFELEKGLRTKDCEDMSTLDEERRKYFEGD